MYSKITDNYGSFAESTALEWHRWFAGADGARDLVREVQADGTVKKLWITANGVEGWDAIGEMLISNTSLKTLDAPGCGIGDAGAKAFADGLSKNTALESLDLSGNQFGDAGVFAIATAVAPNKSLHRLSLARCGFGKMGLTSIAAGCIALNDTLQVLDLQENQIGDDGAIEIAHALQMNSSLVTIGLHKCGIGDRGASSLASISNSRIS
jgi:Ran GTPase-activating protein (RanGAP) involved in mRNA processing and transport